MKHREMRRRWGRILAFAVSVMCTAGSLYSVSFGADKKADFYDIKGHWAEKAIEPLITKGIVTGVPVNGVMEVIPDMNISRVDFVAMVVRAFSLKTVDGNVKTFKDDKKGAWYNDVLKAATSNELLAGYPDGGFHPGDPVTNEQVSIILTRLRNQQLKASGKAVDTSWYATNILRNVRAEFKLPPAASFVSKKNATRAETLAALYSFMAVTEKADRKSPAQDNGTTPTIVGGSGVGDDPASMVIAGSTDAGGNGATGSAGNGTGSGTGDNSGAAAGLPPAVKTGVLGYNYTAAKGELVYFQVYAFGLKELKGLDFKITYDPKVVVATSFTNGSIKGAEYIKSGDVDLSQADAGTMLIKNQDSSPIKTSDGTLFTVVFRVQRSASGSTAISMKSSSGTTPLLYGADGGAISSVACTDGKITVK